MKLVFVIAVLSIILFSCKSSTERGIKKDETVADVRNMLDSYYNDIKKEGLMAEFKYLDSSDNFFWVPPGYSSAISYDSVAAVLRANAVMLSSVNNSWDTLSIVPLSNELATYTGRLRSTITDISGKSTQMKLVETGIVIKRKAGWKLLCGQTAMLE